MKNKTTTVEEIKAYVRKYWKEGFINKEEKWPKVINFPDAFPVVKAEIYKDGSMNIWPKQPLEWVNLKLTCPEDMEMSEFEKIVKESVEEGGQHAK